MLIDTHIWVWLVSGDARLKPEYRTAISMQQPTGIFVSIISVWEVAKLVEYGKLSLSIAVSDWLKAAESYAGLRVLPLTSDIVIDSTTLPGEFHKDPADQLIDATARVLGLKLMTMDAKILAYPHVDAIKVKSAS